MRKYAGYIMGGWLGVGLTAVGGFHIVDWQWWALFAPTILIFAWAINPLEV